MTNTIFPKSEINDVTGFVIPCKRCAGKGRLSHFNHVEEGICFACNGRKWIDATKDEYESWQASEKRNNKGQYVLFYKGVVEFYKSEKEIVNKYGRFHYGSYGGFSGKVAYDYKHTVYDRVSDDIEIQIAQTINLYATLRKDEIDAEIKAFEKVLNVAIRYKDIDEIKELNKNIERLKKEIQALEDKDRWT